MTRPIKSSRSTSTRSGGLDRTHPSLRKEWQTPMASEAELVDPFNQAFDRIKEGIKQAVEKFNELVGRVQDKWWMFSLAGAAGAAAALYIKNGLDQCRDALEQLIQKVQYAVEHQTPVLSLIIASFRW